MLQPFGRVVIFLSLFTAAIAWSTYFYLDRLASHPIWFGRALYFATVGLLALTVAKFYHFYRSGDFLPIPIPKKLLTIGILGASLISAAVFWIQRPDYRILQDEAVLTSMSYMMAKHQTATALYMSRTIGNELVPLRPVIDKRPPLFPFFVHLLHLTFGYSPMHPLVVNAFVFWVFLLVVFLTTATAFGISTAIVAQLLVAGQPAVFLSATSAGFDLFSSLLLLLALLSAARAIGSKRPSSIAFSVLILACFCFSRYESIALAGVIGMGIAWACRGTIYRSLNDQATWIAPLALLMTPLGWLLLWIRNPALHEVTNGEPIFSATNFVSHAVELGHGLFAPPPNYPNLSIFYGLAVLSGVLVTWKLRQQKQRQARLIVGVTLSAALASLTITLAHFYGIFSQADALRLFLNGIILFSLLPAWALGLYSREYPWLKKIQPLFVVLSVSLFFFALSSRSASQFFADIGSTRAFHESRDFLKGSDKRTTMIVSRFPTNFVILGFSSIDFETFQRNQLALMESLRLKNLTHIFFFQNISAGTGSPLDGETLPVELSLETLSENPVSARHRLRILEVSAK